MAYRCAEEEEGNDGTTLLPTLFPAFTLGGTLSAKFTRYLTYFLRLFKGHNKLALPNSAQRLYFRLACSIKEPPCIYCTSSRCEHLGIAQPQSFHINPLRLFTIPGMTYCYYHLSIKVDYIQVKARLSGH